MHRLQNLVEGEGVVTTHRLLLEDEYGTSNHRINVLIPSVPEQICQKLLKKHHFTSLPLHMPGMANKKFLDLRLCMGGRVEGTRTKHRNS